MPLRGNEKFKLKSENGFQRIGGGTSIFFNLASPFEITVRGTKHEITKITIMDGRWKEIGGELQGGKNISLYYNNGGFNFPVGEDKIQVLRGGSMIIENKDKEITIEVERSVQEERTREKRENQIKILNWINNNFSLMVDSAGNITNINGETINIRNTENFQLIYQTIKNYIGNHSQQFSLSKDFVTLPFDRHGTRPWWCPQVPEGDPRNIFQKGAREGNGGKVVSGIRKIQLKNNENFYLHPNAFSQEQYEELKNLIPNTCRVAGCYSNFSNNYLTKNISLEEMTSNKYNSDYNFAVVDGVCGYHRMIQNNNQTNANNPPLRKIILTWII